MPFQTSNEKSEMVNEIPLPFCVMASCSADLKGLNSKFDIHVNLFFVDLPTTHVKKGDGKSHDWIDGLKLPDYAKILAQNTGLVFTLRSGSEGPSRDNVIGRTVVGGREVLCRATLTAYGGVVRIVRYPVVGPWGKPIGTLNVSFKFNDMVAAPSEEVAVAATCEYSKGFDEVARELSLGFDEAAREPVTKYPAPVGDSMAHARYALLQPLDSAGYAPSAAVPVHTLPPAVSAPQQQGYAYPPQVGVHLVAPPTPQQVNKKNNFRAKLRALFTGVSIFSHLAPAGAVMSANVDPGTDAADFGFDDGGFLWF